MDSANVVNLKSLKENLNEFKNISETIIEYLEIENYDEIENLLSKREDLIKTMNHISYSKEEFKSLCDKYDIIIIEERMQKLVKEKQAYIKRDLGIVSQNKNATKNYNSKINNGNAIFLNKKI